jgi:hypothetical protein
MDLKEEAVVPRAVWRLGHELDDQGSIHDRDHDGFFSLGHSVQIDSGAHVASYPTGTAPPSNAAVQNGWCYTSTPQYVFMAWCLVKQ